MTEKSTSLQKTVFCIVLDIDDLSPFVPFRVSFDPEDLRIEGNLFPSTLRSSFDTESQDEVQD